MKKGIFMVGTCLLLMIGIIGNASAGYIFTYGKNYQNATIKDIPRFGGTKCNLNYGSKKATTTQVATFKKVKVEAALGNTAFLADKNKKRKSRYTGIKFNSQYAGEYDAKKGTTYFAGVASSTFEPSNKCDVKLKFSADMLK